MGKGMVVEKHTGSRGKYGSSDVTAEVMAYIRNIFDEKQVPYQIVELGKVDEGGGGTYFLNDQGLMKYRMDRVKWAMIILFFILILILIIFRG